MTILGRRYLGSLKRKYKTHKKPPPSELAMTVMNSRLSIENEFYEYVKTRYLAFLKEFKTSEYMRKLLLTSDVKSTKQSMVRAARKRNRVNKKNINN